MRAHRFRVVALLLVVISSPATISSQGDPLTKWRKSNERGNRYEGVDYARPVGLDSGVELIGLHRFFREFYPHKLNLHLRFELPDLAQSVAVTARELNPQVFYRMELKTPPRGWVAGRNVVSHWPVADVLAGANLRLEDLAAVVRFTRDGMQTYAPVDVFPSTSQWTAAPVTAVFLPRHDFEAGTFQVLEGCPGGKAVSEIPTSASSSPLKQVAQQYAMSPFVVVLPETAARFVTLRLTLTFASPPTHGARASTYIFCVALRS